MCAILLLTPIQLEGREREGTAAVASSKGSLQAGGKQGVGGKDGFHDV